MSGSYNLTLVFASYCVAVIAAYTAIYFGSRLFNLSGAARSFWLAIGALCMGTGIWSMHFVGMSAYNMPMDMEMTFSAPLTFLSWVPAVLASALALYVITLPKANSLSIAASATCMGTGIFAMHYGGMYAMQMQPQIQYDALLVVVSGAIAIIASGAALVICRKVRDVPAKYQLATKTGAALVMGVAICGMHYTGMAAAIYPSDAQMALDNSLRGDWMGIPTAMAAGGFLLAALYLAYSDFRAAEQERLAKEEMDRAAAHAAFNDIQTGLANRAALEEQVLEKLSVQNDTDRAAPFQILYFELDDYRDIHSARGEPHAQKLAGIFADRLTQAFSQAEILARVNSNGFSAVVPGNDAEKIKPAIAKLADSLQQPVKLDDETIICRWSLGYSQYPKSGTNSRLLIRQAQKIRQRFAPTKTTFAAAV